MSRGRNVVKSQAKKRLDPKKEQHESQKKWLVSIARRNRGEKGGNPGKEKKWKSSGRDEIEGKSDTSRRNHG